MLSVLTLLVKFIKYYSLKIFVSLLCKYHFIGNIVFFLNIFFL